MLPEKDRVSFEMGTRLHRFTKSVRQGHFSGAKVIEARLFFALFLSLRPREHRKVANI